jgi:hypothetical protein
MFVTTLCILIILCGLSISYITCKLYVPLVSAIFKGGAAGFFFTFCLYFFSYVVEVSMGRALVTFIVWEQWGVKVGIKAIGCRS